MKDLQTSELTVRFRKEPLENPLEGIPSRKWKEFILDYYNGRNSEIIHKNSMFSRITPVRVLLYFFLSVPVPFLLWFVFRKYLKFTFP